MSLISLCIAIVFLYYANQYIHLFFNITYYVSIYHSQRIARNDTSNTVCKFNSCAQSAGFDNIIRYANIVITEVVISSKLSHVCKALFKKNVLTVEINENSIMYNVELPVIVVCY